MRTRGLIACAALAASLVAAAPAAATDSYEVGTAVRSINPTQGELDTKQVFLGGFGIGGNSVPGEENRYATGILGDGPSVRAFAVSDGHGHGFAIADIETQGWFVATRDGALGLEDMRKAVALRTGGKLSPQDVVVQSDHSHTGADAMGVWGGVPTSFRQRMTERTIDALVAAWNSRQPADLYYGTAPGNGPGLVHLLNNQFEWDPANQALDHEVRVLQARDPETGANLATLLNFSAHADVLGSGTRKISGDWVQAINPILEQRLGGAAVTIVGTLGRSQPDRPGCPTPGLGDDARALCEIDTYAGRVADRAEMAIANAQPLGGDGVVKTRSYLIEDPATNPVLVAAAIGGGPAGLPINRALTPPWIQGNVIGTVTQTALIGDVLLSAGPGEMYPQIPQAIRDIVGKDAHGFMTAGLAGDQLGYLIAPFPDAFAGPMCTSVASGCEDPQPGNLEPSPIDNDNYFFDASHTIGDRVTCSLLRGAGEVLGKGGAYRDALPIVAGGTDIAPGKCNAFASDLAFAAGADADLSGVSTPAAKKKHRKHRARKHRRARR